MNEDPQNGVTMTLLHSCLRTLLVGSFMDTLYRDCLLLAPGSLQLQMFTAGPTQEATEKT